VARRRQRQSAWREETAAAARVAASAASRRLSRRKEEMAKNALFEERPKTWRGGRRASALKEGSGAAGRALRLKSGRKRREEEGS